MKSVILHARCIGIYRNISQAVRLERRVSEGFFRYQGRPGGAWVCNRVFTTTGREREGEGDFEGKGSRLSSGWWKERRTSSRSLPMVSSPGDTCRCDVEDHRDYQLLIIIALRRVSRSRRRRRRSWGGLTALEGRSQITRLWTVQRIHVGTYILI